MTVEKILLEFSPEPKNILPVLKRVNGAFGFVGDKHAGKIARYFQVPLTRIFETATFYDLIKTKRGAPLEIRVCSGANCATKDAYRLIGEIERQLNIKSGDQFNPDVRLEIISCLGQCGNGPVMIINGEIFLRTTPRMVQGILKNYL